MQRGGRKEVVKGVSHIWGLSCDQWGLILEKGVDADCRERISKGCEKGM